MVLTDKWTIAQARLADVLAQNWVGTWSWPTFSFVAETLELEGLDALEILKSFPVAGDSAPGRASYSDVRFDHTFPFPPEDSEVSLSVSGLAKHRLGEEAVLVFMAALRTAAILYVKAPTEPSGVKQVRLTSELVAKAVPGASRELVLAVDSLLSDEPVEGRVQFGRDPEGRWSIVFGRGIVKYRDVNIDGYLSMILERFALTSEKTWLSQSHDGALGVTLMPVTSTPDMPPKVFVSHASIDEDLGGLLSETLVLGGVPQDRIFYSSNRSTGIATGADLRSRLRDELRQAGLVVQLLTPTFFSRPMCMLELGGAWALGKATYPIVIPPQTREDSVSILGELILGSMASEATIDETFDELRDRISGVLQIALPSVSWNKSIRRFKQALPAMLEQVAELSLSAKSPSVSAKLDPASPLIIAGDDDRVRFSDIAIMDGYGGASKIAARAINLTSRHLTVYVKAVFLRGGKIVGTEDGSVGELGPSRTKSFDLETIGSIPEFDTLEIEVSQIF